MNSNVNDSEAGALAPAAPRQASDISELDAIRYSEEGHTVKILNPRTGAETGLEITVQGAFAGRFQESLGQQRKRDALRSKNPVAQAVAASDDEETSQLLASVTIGWTNMIENGVQVPFTKANARRIYEAYPVIRGQVLASAVDVGNFVRG